VSICQDAALNAMNENIETLDVRPLSPSPSSIF
jgi:hypothetical protein